MELSKDIPQDNVSFAKEKSILNDIAQETREMPGYGSLTEEELMEKVENILLERIKNGEKHAYFQLGLFYYEQNMFDKARIYFERSKDFDFQSLYMLASMLYDGQGGKPDEKAAVEYLKKIALSDSKHAKHLKFSALFNIGRAYFQGYGVKQSDDEALRYWLLAADDGNPSASVPAQTTLGMFYSRPDSLDLKKAFFWHNEACGNGSLESQGALGVMYEYGIGVKQDADSAYVCLKEASDRGNVYAMGNLVANYYRRKLYTKAADLAARVSQFSDVKRLAEETGCLPSYLAKGIAMGCFYYARCLHEGHGVKKDEEEAKKYYSKSYQFDPDVCARLQNITQHGVI
ncbi:LRP2-binding protein-like [Saccostrea echinata]|uniref:LRP2-binding protein-like n=1 Tax=Saccostrea echinata TaxID=191078 RepID=UPI002A80FF56|nr:LRP2-binding protein-like [Saccostrea echinata]